MIEMEKNIIVMIKKGCGMLKEKKKKRGKELSKYNHENIKHFPGLEITLSGCGKHAFICILVVPEINYFFAGVL